jgi:hypothetical protein
MAKIPPSSPNHASLKPLPKMLGGYYRRIADINRALVEMDAEKLPAVVQFLVVYFACEKLALGATGIACRWAVEDAYDRNMNIDLARLQSAAIALSLSISDGDLARLFGMKNDNPPTARMLRNALNHDFGPSRVKLVRSHCKELLPIMRKFLACIDEVHKYQMQNF